jgi:hypothetical protein
MAARQRMLTKRFTHLRNNSFDTISRVVWMLGMVLLPITSLPLLVTVTGATTVAPPSVLFILFVAITWVLPYILFTRGSLPFEVGPFLVFFLVTSVSWALSVFLPILPYRNFTITTGFAETFFTLGIAAAVYTTTATWVSAKPERLRFTMQFISLSGLVLILWCIVQAYYILAQDGTYPPLILQLQTLVSSRMGTWLFADRLTGMAYEPSYLAHQLVLVYIPLWFSATISQYTAFSKKIFWFRVENLLLVGGILALFLSFSRIGWLSFLLMVAYAMVFFNILLVRKIRDWLAQRYSSSNIRLLSVVITMIVILFLFISYLGITLGAIMVGASFEPRLARILSTDFSNTADLLDLSNRLFFAERAVYWLAGLDVFGKYPWLGVGVGNAGLFFPETMPSYGYGLTEIRDLFYRFEFLPNTKSMWVRILAETGVVGFSFFISWIFIVFQSSHLAKIFGTPEAKVIGWMGQFVIIAYLAEGFSLDSFAMPYIWLALGLATAAGALTRKKIRSDFNGFLR